MRHTGLTVTYWVSATYCGPTHTHTRPDARGKIFQALGEGKKFREEIFEENLVAQIIISTQQHTDPSRHPQAHTHRTQTDIQTDTHTVLK